MMDEISYSNLKIGRIDSRYPADSMETAIDEGPSAPYNARVVFQFGTYVDFIAYSTLNTEDIEESAKEVLSKAYENGEFSLSDEYDDDNDDNEYEDEKDEGFSFIKKDALTLDAVKVVLSEDSVQFNRAAVNAPDECVRLAEQYNEYYSDSCTVIFKYGTAVEIYMNNLECTNITPEEYAVKVLSEEKDKGGDFSMPLGDDITNEHGDILYFRLQPCESACVNVIFNYFWVSEEYSYIDEDLATYYYKMDCEKPEIVKVIK